jgi:hypothetical protein
MIAERSAHRLFAFVAYGAVLMAGVSLGLSWGSYPPQLTAALVVLVIAVAISENFSLDLAPGTISLGFPLTIAAIVLLGPTAAALVSAVGAVSFIDVRRGKPAAVILYNLSGFVLVTLAAGWAYLWTGGRVLLGAGGPAPFGAADFPVLLLPMVVVALVSVLGNVLFTSVGEP